jgi:hypothetical protein
MIDEFRVLPIPAYNMQSNLVHPTQYRRTLKDASDLPLPHSDISLKGISYKSIHTT